MEVKLTDICDIQYGYAFDSEQFSETEGTPLIRIRDVVRGFSETRTTESFPPEYAVHNGDILIGMDGEFNTARWHGGTAALNQRVCRLIPKMVDADYIFHFMPIALKAIEAKTPFVTVKHLSAKELNRITVPFPTLTEQMRIGTILNRVLHIIEMRKQELQSLDDLINARFVEMFGDPNEERIRWNEVSIGDHCFVTKLAGFEYTNYIHYEDSGDVVMVKAQNVKRGSLNEKDLSYISQDISDSLPRSQLAPGDIVMTYVGANIGDVAIIDDRHKYHLAPNVAKIRPDRREYNPVFFMYMLMMKTDYIMRNSADTAKAALGMERIRRLKVFNPPLGPQNEFSAFVAQVDKSKVAVKKALDEAQLLFDSLMQQYFD